MSRSITAIVVIGCLLATGTLLLLSAAVGVGELTSASAAAAALVLGCLAGLLTTFTGCTSLPTTAELTRAKDRIETARDKLGRERLSIQLKLDDVARLVQQIENEVGGRLGRWAADRDEIIRWTQAIDQRKEQIELEARQQLQLVEMLIETAAGVIERAEALEATARELLEQSSFEPPTGGDPSHYVLGWRRFLDESAELLARARVRLQIERLDEEQLRLHIEGEAFGLVRLERLVRRVARKPSRRRVAALAEQVRALIERRAELLHVGFADDWGEVLDVIELFTANGTPTLVVRPEPGGDPTTGSTTEPGRDPTTIQLRARIRIDESLVGPFTRGDVLVLSLPEGFTLGAPLQLEAAEGTNLKVCGNEAGSKAVALEIRGDWGSNPKWIEVTLDQALTIEGASVLGWAGVWSLARNTGTTVPVSVLPCD